MSRFLRAGAIAGAVAGIAMAIVLRLFGEGPIGDAVAAEARHETVHDELYTRAVQHVGGMIGVAIYGVFIGVIVAVVLAAVRHRLPLRDDWRRAMLLAGVGFVTVFLVPFLKYPANPPGVGDPDTITRRTLLRSPSWSSATLNSSCWRRWRIRRRPSSPRTRTAFRMPATRKVYQPIMIV